MKVTGSCHCGQVAYEAEIDPEKVSLCNCTDCQKLTGSVYRVNIQAPREAFRLISGRLATYIKTAASGNKRAHSFCPDCGSPVYACALGDNPPAYSLRVGCLDQKAQLPPKRQIWCDSALPWSRDVSGIPGQARQ
jgi:hypothetical protein